MVYEERMKSGMSQNQLAKLSGVPQSVICDIESGKTRNPRIDTLQAIAKVLGITVDELVSEEQKAG